jgi:hypothetical protein
MDPAGTPNLQRQCGLLGNGQRDGFDRAPHRSQSMGCGKKFRRLRQFGMANGLAARAADLPRAGSQACNIDVVGCSAVRANDEQGDSEAILGKPNRGFVNELETKPAVLQSIGDRC